LACHLWQGKFNAGWNSWGKQHSRGGAAALITALTGVVVSWTLRQYLQDLECPSQAALDNENRPAVLEWLLSFAIGLEYADHGDFGSAIEPAANPCLHLFTGDGGL
jgi:hypothetical protein